MRSLWKKNRVGHKQIFGWEVNAMILERSNVIVQGRG